MRVQPVGLHERSGPGGGSSAWHSSFMRRTPPCQTGHAARPTHPRGGGMLQSVAPPDRLAEPYQYIESLVTSIESQPRRGPDPREPKS